MEKLLAEGDSGLCEEEYQSNPQANERRTKGNHAKVAKCPCCKRSVEKCNRWHGEKENRLGKRILLGPGCADCYELFVAGDFQHRTDVDVGSFEKCCRALSNGNETQEKDVSTARAVKCRTEELSSTPEECTEVVRSGWRVVTEYRGYSQQQFKHWT